MNYSYANDMWLGFDRIIKHFNLERNIIKTFLYIASEKKNAEEDYADNLKRLHIYFTNAIKISDDFTLSKAIISYIDQLKAESEIHLKNVKVIEESVLLPIGKLMEDQLDKSFKLTTSLSEYPQKFASVISTLESYRLEYNSASKLSESTILNAEQNKEKNTNPAKGEKKSAQSIKSAKEKEKTYIDFIREANHAREEYVKKTEELLSSYQEMDTELINNIKDKLMLISDEHKKIYQALTELNASKATIFNMVSSEKDLEQFIQKNQTYYKQPLPFQFIPYKSDQNFRVTMGTEEKSLNSRVLQAMNEKFALLTAGTLQDSKIKKDVEYIENAVKEIWEEKKVDLPTIFNLLEKAEYRSSMLNSVNRFRIEGLYLITKKTFEALATVMNSLLEKADKNNDIENIRFCLILSETFSVKEDKEKLLQEGIESNPVWKKKGTWEGMIKNSISEDLSSQDGYLSYLNGTEQSREKRESSSAFENLVIFWLNMKRLKYPIDESKKIIEEFASKYKIDTIKIYEKEDSSTMLQSSMESTIKTDEIKVKK